MQIFGVIPFTDCDKTTLKQQSNGNWKTLKIEMKSEATCLFSVELCRFRVSAWKECSIIRQEH